MRLNPNSRVKYALGLDEFRNNKVHHMFTKSSVIVNAAIN